MSVKSHGFVEWEEKFVSQERGNRVVHYFLKDSAGSSVLAVVGTERSLWRMHYVVSEEFLQVYGSEKEVKACFKWRSRREVVAWLTLWLSKLSSPRDRSSKARWTSVRSLVEKDLLDEPEASETEKVKKSSKPRTASKGMVIKAKDMGLKKRKTRQASFKTVGAGTTVVVDDDTTLTQPPSVKKSRNSSVTSQQPKFSFSSKPPSASKGKVIKAKNLGLKKRNTRQASSKTVCAGTVVVNDDTTSTQPPSVKKPWNSSVTSQQPKFSFSSVVPSDFPQSVNKSAIYPLISPSKSTAVTSVRKDLSYLEYPKDVMNDDDVVSQPDSPLDDADFWASLDCSLSVPQQVSPESRIDPSLVIEAKKKLKEFIAMDFLNVLHPDRRTALAEAVSVLHSLPDLSHLHRSFLNQVSSILQIGNNFDEDAKKLADVGKFLSEYEDLKIQALSFKDSHEQLKIEATPLGEEIDKVKADLDDFNHQFTSLRGRLADLESLAKQKEQEMKLILKEAKLTVQKRQSMAPEAWKAVELKSRLQSKQEEILKLWMDARASFPSDL
ncbi:hypothetical protein HHK36_003389 [Tetracentron sinense]|uniref:Uncharacterized protein n=1 Tax=Tetracentron sinense TaxID=13715 RepID=A0A835DSG2_TETSI|nr:hypothetical protein HHK36_003389 [Tetracentron sinense]